jgi:hypothetical protein
VILCVVLWGCARTPSGLGSSLATRLIFKVNFNAPIDPQYIYVVAIRVLTPPVGSDPQLSDPNQGPVPIVGTGSLNGVVGGWPTHYVIYNPNGEPLPFEVFRFPLGSTPGDPTAPLNLSFPGQDIGPCLPVDLIDPAPTSGGQYGSTFQFAIDTSYLDQEASGPGAIQVIQFNILTMNVQATSGSSGIQRVIDAIGNQSETGGTFNNPITVNIQGDGNYSDVSSGVTELANDTYGGILPPIDMIGWSLSVQTP